MRGGGGDRHSQKIDGLLLTRVGMKSEWDKCTALFGFG
jgi:hypothetical protein